MIGLFSGAYVGNTVVNRRVYVQTVCTRVLGSDEGVRTRQTSLS